MPTDTDYRMLMQNTARKKREGKDSLKSYMQKGMGLYSDFNKLKSILSSLYGIAESPAYYSLRSLK